MSSDLPNPDLSDPLPPAETTGLGASLFSQATPPPSEEIPSPDPLSGPLNVPPNLVGGDGSGSRVRWIRSRKQLLKPFRAGVHTAGGIVAELLTRPGTPEREAQLWVPDDDDAKAIGDPLAGLASRRMGDGPENPDVTDLIGLAIGLLGYVVKQRVKRTQLYQAFAGDMPHEAEPEQPDEVAL
ncbi:MAG: hypothetical protein QM714_12365 [Nocardioides sp.]|uniref:hypothetical protein n=1 Tax=Nocardioides sp. TaxID=35761 RepID=UPI0039E2E66D